MTAETDNNRVPLTEADRADAAMFRELAKRNAWAEEKYAVGNSPIGTSASRNPPPNESPKSDSRREGTAHWRTEPPDAEGHIGIADNKGVCVATCWNQPFEPNVDAITNSRIVAAAPELLEACVRARKGFALLIAANDLNDDENEQVLLLDAAIAKATTGD